MLPRRSEYDVTNQVDTTAPEAVKGEVCRIYAQLYSHAPTEFLARAFDDCARLYRGGDARYRGCDTPYHNLQHTLEVALATARLMNGYERGGDGPGPIGARLFQLGVITALFHDVGYLRHRNDTRHRNGAAYTLRHVSRGARFLEQYMIDLGMADLARIAGRIIHFTGYEVPLDQIEMPNDVLLRIGHILGAADIIAQMADRCYLEKCRDRLYPEFVVGGLASEGTIDAAPTARFSSAEDLLRKTPGFYAVAIRRLNELLGGAHHYASEYFGGQNLYLEELVKNIRHAERVAANADIAALLRRNPPEGGTDQGNGPA